MYKLFFLVLFILSSCSSPKQTIKYPKWFYEGQGDTKLYYYGIGEGGTKQEAKLNALNDIASKISTEIKSSFTSTTSSFNETYSKSSSKNIIAKVKNIEFSSFKIVNSFKLSNNKYVVLLSIDRIKNANIKIDKISAKIKALQQKIKLNLNDIYKLKLGNKIYKTIEDDIIPEIFVVKSLDNDKDITKYIDSMLEIKKEILSFGAGVSFNIIGKNIAYNNVLKEEISDKGFSFKTSKKSVKIYLSVKESSLKVMGNNILKAVINIKIKANNALIAQKIIKLAGKSRTSLKQAKEFAIIEFKNKLKKDNILKKLLGL